LTSTDIGHQIAYYDFDVTPYVSGRQSSGASFVSFAFARNTPGPDESLVLINSLESNVNRPVLSVVPAGATVAQVGQNDETVSSAIRLMNCFGALLVVVLAALF